MAKTKPIKDKRLGARVDAATEERVNTYLEAHDELTMGALVRKSVEEYMLNHPLKGSKPDTSILTKPGE